MPTARERVAQPQLDGAWRYEAFSDRSVGGGPWQFIPRGRVGMSIGGNAEGRRAFGVSGCPGSIISAKQI